MTRSGLSRSSDVVTYDPEANAYYAHHDWSDQGSLSVTLITALAEIADADPTEMQRLGAHVNPDALDTLFEPRSDDESRSAGRLELPVDDYHVTVYADGEIVIRP